MKRTFVAVALATTLGVGGYFAVAPSSACCGDGIAAAAGAESAGAAVVAAIGSAASSMSVLLNNMNSNITSGLAMVSQEISKQTASQKTFEEGSIQAATQLYMEEKRGDAAVDYALSPRACFEAQAATAVAGGTASVNQTTSNLMRGLQERTLFTANTAAAVDKIYRTHADKFCSDRDVALGRCSRAAAPELQNADVRADNILGEDVLSGAQLEAATAYLNNVINAVPTQNVPKGWERTPQGKAFVAGQLIEQSKLSTAALSMSRMVAMRKVEPGLGAKADLNVGDVSPMQLMKAQVNGRFMDPNWYKMIVGAGFGEVNQLREANKMMAFQLYLDMQAYEQGERIEAMLAADIATSIKRDSEQRLSQARAAAAKSR